MSIEGIVAAIVWLLAIVALESIGDHALAQRVDRMVHVTHYE
jgi:hypothetical protein